MNRQIKFRALELDTGNWVYGGFVSIDGYAMIGGKPNLNDPVTRYYIFQYGKRREVCEDTVGQFTGLLDKNGVEIYESDVVLDHVGVGVVEYNSRRSAFRVNYRDGTAKWFIDYTLKGERFSIKIIGNMHQNPELLK